jgi:hypothetical protein
MMKRNNDDLDEMQAQCMLRLIHDILSDKSVTEITYESMHGGAIHVKRDKPEKSNIHVIGFSIDSNDNNDEE